MLADFKTLSNIQTSDSLIYESSVPQQRGHREESPDDCPPTPKGRYGQEDHYRHQGRRAGSALREGHQDQQAQSRRTSRLCRKAQGRHRS